MLQLKKKLLDSQLCKYHICSRQCSITGDYGVWPECATCFTVSTHREQCSSFFFFALCDLLLADCKCQVCSSTALCSAEASMSKKHVYPFIVKSFWVRAGIESDSVTAREAARTVYYTPRYLDRRHVNLQSCLPKLRIMVLSTCGFSGALVLDTCRAKLLSVSLMKSLRAWRQDVIFLDAYYHFYSNDSLILP